MPVEIISPQLIEGVVDGLIAYLQANLPGQLAIVQAMYPAGAQDSPLPPPVSYFISERFVGLQTPAVFVLAEQSEHALDAMQNAALQNHRIQVVALIEVVGDEVADRLARTCWRYARALWQTLHDATLSAPYPTSTVLVEGIKYSPVLPVTSGAQRVFRKEAWLDVLAQSVEPFA